MLCYAMLCYAMLCKVAEHQAVWDEAQRMFRERVAAREPTLIDVPGLTGPGEEGEQGPRAGGEPDE